MDKDTILKRQTDYTRKELVALIKDGGVGRPSCLYINELVVLFWQGDAEAGKFLCNLLQASQLSTNEQYPVYAGLASALNPNKEVRQALEEFRSKPENQTMVEFGRSDIEEAKGLLAQAL